MFKILAAVVLIKNNIYEKICDLDFLHPTLNAVFSKVAIPAGKIGGLSSMFFFNFCLV